MTLGNSDHLSPSVPLEWKLTDFSPSIPEIMAKQGCTEGVTGNMSRNISKGTALYKHFRVLTLSKLKAGSL